MILEDTILKLTKQLFPTGRAYKLAKDSIFQKTMFALGKSEARAYQFAIDTLDRILPDTDAFTTEDATLWEQRLNIPVNPPITLDQRKQAITRKYAFPGTAIYRQNYRYLEEQLQKAGFDVYVHENRFPDGGGGFITVGSDIIEHSDDLEHGYETEMGATGDDLIANSADPNEVYSIGTNPENLKGTFFIGGQNFPDRANILFALQGDFRKLVLLIKPVATVGILLLDYPAVGVNMAAVSGDNLVAVSGDNIVSVDV